MFVKCALSQKSCIISHHTVLIPIIIINVIGVLKWVIIVGYFFFFFEWQKIKFFFDVVKSML